MTALADPLGSGVGGTYGTINLIWQASVSSTNLHSYNNELTDSPELPREGGIDIGIPKTQANGAAKDD